MSESLREQVDAYQRSCFTRHRAATVGELAKQLGISRVTLSKRFRHEEGKTLQAYLMEQRIAYIKHLLRTTNLSIASVATRVGYKDERSLHRTFRRETGMTPAEFRRRNR